MHAILIDSSSRMQQLQPSVQHTKDIKSIELVVAADESQPPPGKMESIDLFKQRSISEEIVDEILSANGEKTDKNGIIELSMNDFIQDNSPCYRIFVPFFALLLFGYGFADILVYDYNYYDSTIMAGGVALFIIWFLERSNFFTPKWPVYKIDLSQYKDTQQIVDNLTRAEIAILKLSLHDRWYKQDYVQCCGKYNCISLYWILVLCVGAVARLVMPNAVSYFWVNVITANNYAQPLMMIENYIRGPFSFISVILGLIVNGMFHNTRHIFQHRCYCKFLCIDEYLCWRVIQYHHSQSRFSMLMGFYFNPIESIHVTFESLFVSWVFGFNQITIFYIYMIDALQLLISHANIITPRTMGYFTIRPEQHCLHHLEPWPRPDNWKRKNYSNCPIAEMFFGTFENPEIDPREDPNIIVGFPEQSHDIFDILFLRKNLVKERYQLTKNKRIYFKSLDQLTPNQLEHSLRQN